MLRRIIGMARGRATGGGATGAARPGMGGPRPMGRGPRAGRMGPAGGAGGNAEIQRGVRSLISGFGKRRRGL
jgi:hypothetical protein